MSAVLNRNGTWNQGRRNGIPLLSRLIVIAGLCLAFSGCASHPISPHHARSRAAARTTITTGTRIINFHILRYNSSSASIQPSIPRQVRLHFQTLTRGTSENWSWTVLADRPLVPLYRVYARTSPLKWSMLFTLLRKQAGSAFGSPLPALRFTIRMVPSGASYFKRCIRISVRDIPVCYAFPYPTNFGKRGLVWPKAMVIAASYLSHETALALIENGGLVPPAPDVATEEAQATLFNMYMSWKFINSAPQLHAILLPPMTYGISRSTLSGMGWADRGYWIGGQMAALAMQRSLRGERALCWGDVNGLSAYRALLYRTLHQPALLHDLEKDAQRSLHVRYSGSVVPIHTQNGIQRIPIQAFGKHHANGKLSLPGIFGYAEGTKHFAEFAPLCARQTGTESHPR